MRNLKDFSNFENINEAFKSSILQKMKLKRDEVQQIINSFGLDMSKLKDDDFIKIEGDQITKKTYKEDYVIFVCGDYTEWNSHFKYGEPESEQNPREFKHYGLLYLLRGTNVKMFHGKGVYKGKKRPETPKRGDVADKVTRLNLDAWAVKLKTGEDPVQDLRNKRREAKNLAFVTSKNKDKQANLDWKNNYYKDENTKRYAAELKKKLNFDQIFEIAAKKLEAIAKANLIAVEFYKYYYKVSDPKATSIASEVEKFDKVTFNLKPFEEFYIMIKNEYVKSKTDVLMSIVKAAGDMLKNQNQYSSDTDLAKLKNISKLLKEIPEPDTKTAEEFINSAKWTDSDKLKDLDKKSGIFDTE